MPSSVSSVSSVSQSTEARPAASTDLDAARDQHRAELLDQIDSHPDHAIPCRAIDLHTAGAWTAEDDAEQRTAAAACRATPCPALEACRAYGLTWPRELGAYGGLTERERRRAARRKKAA